MSCSNCFNGCAEPVSDKCVKYTGIDINALGIKNGDTLLHVENKITEKIQELMVGTGTIPVIDPEDVCDLVKSFMPCCTPLNLNIILTVIVKTLCALDSRSSDAETKITKIEEELTTLNENYILTDGCLLGVTESSSTHDILQATVNKVCAIALELPNYVRKDEIKEIVDSIVESNTVITPYNVRMIPWVAYPIFDANTLSYFSAAGVGGVGTLWEKVYLCNGSSYPGIPDLRGRATVGVLAMAGSKALDPEVDPGSPLTPPNPSYALGTKVGYNQAYISNVTQMPSHSHAVTIQSAGSHTHSIFNYPTNRDTIDGGSGTDGQIVTFNGTAVTDAKGDHVHPATSEKIGGVGGITQGHENTQPVIASYYIMYIP